MVAQNCKKIIWQKYFPFLNAYYAKFQLIKALSSLDSSRPYARLLENIKTRGFREFFLPENDFKTLLCSKFSKKHPVETNQRNQCETLSLIFFHMPFYIWAQNNTKIVLGT